MCSCPVWNRARLFRGDEMVAAYELDPDAPARAQGDVDHAAAVGADCLIVDCPECLRCYAVIRW
jgi:hypothetical protein